MMQTFHIHAFYSRQADHAEATANRATTRESAAHWYLTASMYRRLAATA